MSVEQDKQGKYGEKPVGDRQRPVKRSYFRCASSFPAQCEAKKRVDRLEHASPHAAPLSVAYVGLHNHSPGGARFNDGGVGARSGERRGPREGGGEVASLSAQALHRLRPGELAREMYSDIVAQFTDLDGRNTQLCRQCEDGPSSGCRQCSGYGDMLVEPLEGGGASSLEAERIMTSLFDQAQERDESTDQHSEAGKPKMCA